MTRNPREPLIIECTRGDAIESAHAVDVAVVDPNGGIVERWGDIERMVYPRSAIKSVQVLPFIETGVAEQTNASDAEIALACASHNAQPRHVDAVRQWLARHGLAEADLECGPHLPYHVPSAHECVRAGIPGLAVHNMCSGKHTAFLVTAKTLGEPTAGYIARDHPVQQRVSRAIAEMSGWDVAASPWAVDGCSIPTIALPLHHLARAAARIADPSGLSASRQAAIKRVKAAIAAEPFMIAGDERPCTDIMTVTVGKVVVKFGAEGVFFAGLTARGLGLALKVRDGATRAANTAIVTLLDHLSVLDEASRASLAHYLETPLFNWRGTQVGVVRAGRSG